MQHNLSGFRTPKYTNEGQQQ